MNPGERTKTWPNAGTRGPLIVLPWQNSPSARDAISTLGQCLSRVRCFKEV